VLALIALGSTVGCAYFNGVFNAKEAARGGDRLLRAGRESEASGAFSTAAEKAETVLVRYPKSRWRPQALLLAGRGAAYAGDCAVAERRLNEFLSLGAQPRENRDAATLALGACAVRRGQPTRALELLQPLTSSRRKDVARTASVWSSRAALALGDNDAALRYLGALDAGSAQWELISASIARQEYVRAESLLVLRAARGDYRDDGAVAVRELWRAGHHDAVERIARRYDESRARTDAKVTLHMAVADMQLAAGLDTLARAHLRAARRLAADTLLDREASARLELLALHDLSSIPEVEAAVARARPQARGSAIQTRIDDNLLLIHMLEGRQDLTGASLFLAAEVARDSLRSPALAHTLFKRVENSLGNTLLASKALLAAGTVAPDSDAAYRSRILSLYPRSPVAALLRGEDPNELASFRQSDELLRQAWIFISKAYGDSLRKLKAPPTPTTTQSTNQGRTP
jgi:hypothetical protein